MHPARFERTTYGLGSPPGVFVSTYKIITYAYKITTYNRRLNNRFIQDFHKFGTKKY